MSATGLFVPPKFTVEIDGLTFSAAGLLSKAWIKLISASVRTSTRHRLLETNQLFRYSPRPRAAHLTLPLYSLPDTSAHTHQGPVQSNGMCLLELVVHWNL